MFTIWTPIVLEESRNRNQKVQQIMDDSSGKTVDYCSYDKDHSLVHIHFKDGSDLYLDGYKGITITETNN